MSSHSFWQRQTADRPLFPDVEWNRPERRDQAGRLAIIGGNTSGFAAVAEAYATAQTSGAGHIRVLLPAPLKKTVPPSMTDVLFAPTNPSGGLSTDALAELKALGEWADVSLFIGDAGKNSQTAALYEQFVTQYARPLVLTRDSIDLIHQNASVILNNPHIVLVASFAQVQKLFRAVYYPKLLTFRMQLAQFVDVLHKFTITHPVTLIAFHADHLVVARNGHVVTQPWTNPLSIWRGNIATRAASYLLWTADQPLQAVVASLVGQ